LVPTKHPAIQHRPRPVTIGSAAQGSGLDEDFEALAVLHVLVAGRDTVDVGRGVENFAGLDAAVEDVGHELLDVRTHRGRPTGESDVRPEEAAKADGGLVVLGDTYAADHAARADDAEGLPDVEEVEVVVAHNERATLRVGDVFLKIDADQTRTDVEVEAMAMAPIPTPEVLWRKPPVLALAALPGTALGRLGEPSTASSAAWAAAGAAARMLHDAPLPPWPGRSLDELASRLDGECEWLVANDVLPADLVTRNRQVAEAALRPWTPVFTHGDLQVAHVFVDGDEITGVIDWSEAGPGRCPVRPRHPDARTRGAPRRRRRRLRHRRRPRRDPRVVVVAKPDWAIRWLVEHGFDPSSSSSSLIAIDGLISDCPSATTRMAWATSSIEESLSR
jgi:hypothetical protein